MNILFLDIDGVLNGIDYQMSATEEPPLIDKSRLALLREILEKRDIRVVLSSSWKKAWEPGCPFDCIFKASGIWIHDKTPALGRKCDEISAWLKCHPEVDRFVILDDADSGWGVLSPFVVVTDPINRRGLEREHIPHILEKLDLPIDDARKQM